MTFESDDRRSELCAILRSEESSIVASVSAVIRRRRPRYDAAAPDEVARRVERLYDELVAAVSTRDFRGIVAYARELASERFITGYDLADVQVAVNALEEEVWGALARRLAPERLERRLAVVSTVFGAAKDVIAREYLALAVRARAPVVDVTALAAG
jgi:hypothetical protein